MTLTIAWSAQARNQYLATLAYIAKDDSFSAELVYKRVEKSLQLLCTAPEMGIQAATAGVRTYAVPQTGHSFDYRVTKDQIRIQRWYRQRQSPKPSTGARDVQN
jgi:plasmid stabilization system protein ParE